MIHYEGDPLISAHAAWLQALVGKEELLFVNKKKQKNFISFGPVLFQHRAKRSKKVFWFFFSKKDHFLP